MPTMTLGDIELYLETVGGGPPLLMFHGNGLDQTYLRPWHDTLADIARVIYYDQRWNGRSARRGATDHAAWHADAAALLDRLGESRATIYGHSYGSWLALGFAARYPERVARLILCGTSPAFDYAPDVVAEARRRDPVAADVLIAGLERGVKTDDDLARLWRDILPLYFHGETRPVVLAGTQFSAAGFTHAMNALQGFSMLDQLPSLDMPMLVLVGRDDYITPPSQARRLAALAPKATVVEFANSGHFPFVEEPRAYFDAIRTWWQATS